MSAPGGPVYHLYHWLWAFLDLLFPPTCGGCESEGERWCDECQSHVEIIKPPVCDYCGDSINSPGICSNCQTNRPLFSAIRSWAFFEGPVREALHKLKYKRDVSLGIVLASPLINCVQRLDWEIDLVVPVPLGVARLKDRGYNQAALLARPLAMGVRLDYSPHAMERRRETRSQVGLSIIERRENVKGAFQALTKKVSGRRVLVVDDVATSGATLDACAEALLEANAWKVFGLTLARAVKKKT